NSNSGGNNSGGGTTLTDVNGDGIIDEADRVQSGNNGNNGNNGNSGTPQGSSQAIQLRNVELPNGQLTSLGWGLWSADPAKDPTSNALDFIASSPLPFLVPARIADMTGMVRFGS